MTQRNKSYWTWSWLLSALLCVLAISTAWEVRQLAAHANFFARELLPTVERTHELADHLEAMRRVELAHAQAGSSAEQERLQQRMDELHGAVARALNALEQQLPPDSPELGQLRKARAAFSAYEQQWLPQRAASRRAGMGLSLEQDAATVRAYEEARAGLSSWWAEDTRRARAQQDAVKVDTERAFVGLMGMVGLALLLASGAVAGASGAMTRVDPERWASF